MQGESSREDVVDILSEFRRIGYEPEGVMAFGLPDGMTVGDVVARLRELPTGAGRGAIETLLGALPRRARPPWADWPSPGVCFTRDEYAQAFAPINASPEHLVAHYADTPRPVPPLVLALLWHVSPALAARVDTFRAAVRHERLADGMPAEEVEAADAEFMRVREQYADVVARHREEALGFTGPALLFRLRPEFTDRNGPPFFAALGARDFPLSLAVLLDPEPGGTRGVVRLRFGAGVAARAAAEAWLRRHPAVVEVHEAPGPPGWWPADTGEAHDGGDGT